MKHSCRIGYLQSSEDEEGYLYLELKKFQGIVTGMFPIEYCPICGVKAKRSNIYHNLFEPCGMINGANFYNDSMKDNISENDSPLNNPLNNLIKSLFSEACESVFEENLDDECYKFYEDVIKTTLVYLKSKRE